MYLFLRNRTLHPLASVFGALTWIFSGFFVVWLIWNTAVHVVVWTPLILLAIDKWTTSKKSTPRFQYVWLAILFFSLISQFYAGYPQPWLYLSILQGIYALWRIWEHKKIKQAWQIACVFFLAGILMLPQLMATLDFSQLSNRVSDQGNLLEKPDWFIPVPQLLQLIIPDFFGNPATLNYWGIFNYTEFASFIGVIPGLFVLLAVTTWKKHREILFFGVATILALVLSTRNSISILQFQLNVPFIGSSQPSRLLVVITLSLAIMAAYGLHSFLKSPKKLFLPLILMMVLFLSIWVVLLKPDLIGSSNLIENISVARRNTILPTLELVVSGVLLVAILLSQKIRLVKKVSSKAIYITTILLVLISSFVGVRFAKKYTPFTPTEFLYPDTQTTSFLQSNIENYRYMTADRRLMAPNINLAYRIPSIEGYDPLYLADYGRLIHSIETDSYPELSKNFNRIVTTDSVDNLIIDLLGVKYVLSLDTLESPKLSLVLEEGQTKVYENTNVYPRAFFTTDIQSLPPQNYDPVEITAYSPNQVQLSYEASESGYVVLTDAWYPDWQVTTNNHETQLLNWFGLRATIVSEGSNEIIYQYRHSNF